MDFVDMAIIGLLLGFFGHNLLLMRRVNCLMRLLRETAPVLSTFAGTVDRTERVVEMIRREPKDFGHKTPALPGVSGVKTRDDLVSRFFRTPKGEAA